MSKAKKIGLLVIAFVALIIFGIAVYSFLTFRVVRVPAAAMANTIVPGESVLCQMRVGEIRRGDIIVFNYQPDPSGRYIMRVIGLPGETIQLLGIKILINGQELAEARTFIHWPTRDIELKEDSSEGHGAYRVFYLKRESSIRESNIDPGFSGERYGVAKQFQIPKGHYFVLGDNRDNSYDSRHWGTVPRELVIGRALMIVNSKSPNANKRVFKKLE